MAALEIRKERTVVNSAAEVQRMLTRPDRFLIFDHTKDPEQPNKSRPGAWRIGKKLSFTDCLAWLMFDEQLAHTADEMRRLVSGMPKLLALAYPSSDLDVLARYNALTFPQELDNLLANKQFSAAAGVVLSATLKEPYDKLIDIADVRCPISVRTTVSRFGTKLLEAYTRQVDALVKAFNDHGTRLDNRVKNYMFGRPMVTAKQRALDAAMAAYPEFNWEQDILPYLDVRERRL